MKKRAIATLVALLVLGAPSLSWAQQADAGAADEAPAAAGGATVSASELAARGKQEYDAGNWKKAIEFYQRAESLEHSAENLLYWARAAEKLGKLVQARENYMVVLDEEGEGDAIEQMKVEAKTELDALEPRMPWVTIVVKGADIDTEVQVTVDGQPLMPGTLSLKQPIDPGMHEFRTRAGDLEGKPVKATFAEGQHQEISLELPVEKKSALVRHESLLPPPQSDQSEPEPEPLFEDEQEPMDTGSPGLRTAGYVTLGVGVVGLGVGTVFGLQTSSKNDDIRSLCGDTNHCPREVETDVQRLRDDAKSSGILATVGFIVGGVGVATGATLLLVGMDAVDDLGMHANSRSAPSISAWLGPGSAGVRGTF